MATDLATRRPADPLVDLVASLEHLDDDEVLDVIAGLQRERSRLAWAEAQALVRLAGPFQRTHEVLVFDPGSDEPRVVEIADEVREEVAAVLHRSPSTVHDQIATARLLNGPLVTTAQALKEGRITPAHVRVIVEQVRRLPAAVHVIHEDPALDTPAEAADRSRFHAVCDQLQARVLPVAETQVPSQTRALARRAIASIDAEGERRRREAARCTRDVWVSPEEDGLAVLVARLDAFAAHAIRRVLDAAAADPEVTDPQAGTAGERRADALAALVLGHAQVSVNLEVTVPLGAVAAAEGVATGAVSDADRTAVLPDGTLVDWGSALDLLDDPGVDVHLRRLTVDPGTGAAIDLGRSRYQVSEPLRRWIAARDRTCRFPGCRRRASACQVDHIEAWEDGGRTDAANLQALCTRHHQLKTHGGWGAHRDHVTGVTTWRSPHGREFAVPPEPVVLPPPF